MVDTIVSTPQFFTLLSSIADVGDDVNDDYQQQEETESPTHSNGHDLVIKVNCAGSRSFVESPVHTFRIHFNLEMTPSD